MTIRFAIELLGRNFCHVLLVVLTILSEIPASVLDFAYFLTQAVLVETTQPSIWRVVSAKRLRSRNG